MLRCTSLAISLLTVATGFMIIGLANHGATAALAPEPSIVVILTDDQGRGDYLTERAKAGGPFLLYLAYNATHDPVQPPPEWLERVKQREPGLSDKRARLVALIEHLDAGIGKVLEELDRTGLATNTLVIFTSDNGGLLANGANNGPWRSGKGHM